MPSVAVMDARARWGSCTPEHRGAAARIRYSWRLILAPPWVADYVVAHECAHLIEANHGPRFWALVERLFGDPAPARKWLKAEGVGLHALNR
jgi:predicted metal-dependent hydrolase